MYKARIFAAIGLAIAIPCAAQSASAPATAAGADQPSIKVGALIFTDYAIQQQPKLVDADGNTVSFNAFEVTRSYINVTGNISKTISFRVTPDITRETGVGSSLSGSYVFRLKFAYAQWNLDDHVGKGGWARFGQQPTPWVTYIDDIYRYRFQGTMFEERDGFLASADAGATFHYDLPGDYGDLHAGVYNGEGYMHPELNDQKGWMVRGSFRPGASAKGVAHGLRIAGFFDHDMYVKNGDRQRAIVATTFEHQYLNAGFTYLTAKDQTSADLTPIDAKGWSAWVTPRTTLGWEGVLRFDRVEPNTANSGKNKQRTIAGVAYWFPHQGNVASALMFDLDNTKYTGFPSTQAPIERKIAVHAMVSF